MPFSNPSKPGLAEVGVDNGGITVKGYEGNEVIVEARVRERLVQEEKSKKEVKGLRLIRIPGRTGLEIEEEDNVMEIPASSSR